jgi:translocation and assembly module TamB
MVAQLQLSGTFSNPQWQGNISADDLAMRSVADGLDLQDGKLRASLQGTKLTINALELRGGSASSLRILGPSGNRTAPPKDGGILRGNGTVQWSASTQGETGTTGIRIQLTAQAEQLKILVRADRQASISGDLQLQLQQGQFKLRGKLNVDRASILLPDETAPTLGDDVVVRSSRPHPLASDQPSTLLTTPSARSKALPTQVPDITIDLNLGDDFALQGHGITTRLAGQLRIQSNPNHASPEVTGEIKTVQGRYRAWGQLLNVETGLARFNGPYDNPALDILALRAPSNERVGVQISGTALRPQVRLYSDPVRPDAEVLSLLVLGRASASGGLQAGLLQQAAMALLGGKTNGTSAQIASQLGLDEIGLVGLGSGDTANSPALSVGKRLTKDLYVTYEQSLTSTLGTLYIFYELSRKLTLRGQTGARDAVDIVYTMRYD